MVHAPLATSVTQAAQSPILLMVNAQWVSTVCKDYHQLTVQLAHGPTRQDWWKHLSATPAPLDLHATRQGLHQCHWSALPATIASKAQQLQLQPVACAHLARRVLPDHRYLPRALAPLSRTTPANRNALHALPDTHAPIVLIHLVLPAIIVLQALSMGSLARMELTPYGMTLASVGSSPRMSAPIVLLANTAS